MLSTRAARADNMWSYDVFEMQLCVGDSYSGRFLNLRDAWSFFDYHPLVREVVVCTKRFLSANYDAKSHTTMKYAKCTNK